MLRSHIAAGMPVITSDGQTLGRVASLLDEGFTLSQGPFAEDFVVDWAWVALTEAGSVHLIHGLEPLLRAARLAGVWVNPEWEAPQIVTAREYDAYKSTH